MSALLSLSYFLSTKCNDLCPIFSFFSYFHIIQWPLTCALYFLSTEGSELGFPIFADEDEGDEEEQEVEEMGAEGSVSGTSDQGHSVDKSNIPLWPKKLVTKPEGQF